MIPETTLNWPRIIEFGCEKIKTILNHVSDCKKAYVLCDSPIREKAQFVFDEIKRSGKSVLVSSEVVPEPPLEALERLLDPVKAFSPDVVIGIGGGSCLDLAKLVAVLFSEEQTIEDIIGIDKVASRKVKLIAVPTTSGTGSEVTPIAVITDTVQKLKKGVVSPFIVPDVAIVDPELTITVPPSVTAATGMDAMTHCIEAYTNRHSHPIIDNLALEGIRIMIKNIEIAVRNGKNIEARSAMSLGSLYGGLCLGPVNTAAVHALAYPLGGEFKIPHGVSNSVLLPFVMSFNLPCSVEKYSNIGKAMGMNMSSREETAKACIQKIREISEACHIPSNLEELGIKRTMINDMALAAMKVTRLLNNNPREIAFDDAVEIYTNAYHGKIAISR